MGGDDENSPVQVGTPATNAEETKAALQACVRTPAGALSMTEAPQPPLPKRPSAAIASESQPSLVRAV